MMLITYNLLTPLAACLLLSGCLMNSTRPLPTGGTPSPWRAVVVYGMAVEGVWDAPEMGVQLDEYNLADQVTAGGCWFYNRTETNIASVPAPVRYVAFNVPAGSYTYKTGMPSMDNTTTAFIAPPGKVVYIGDFVYTREYHIALRRDLAAFEHARKQALPDLKGEVLLAETRVVKRPLFFLCGP
ncbi:hypothetical protein INH39_28805 [Massilia violaceinigra]|uniref:DUF2846 domain-containing protein n=1 Tax=Massilia violaceinigra TaxID=2045208 RepID=A0ABY4A9U9_9BURK|nr:hypothetical protein [Massilia violaceinigra]UOD29363.1 hypothetical protein INH39_28805 [Massilia violaceinigra]